VRSDTARYCRQKEESEFQTAIWKIAVAVAVAVEDQNLMFTLIDEVETREQARLALMLDAKCDEAVRSTEYRITTGVIGVSDH